MNETKVVNIKHGVKFDIYIGRKTGLPHHYGNPFIIGKDGTREEVIVKFDLWLAGVAYTHIEPRRRKWILDHMEEDLKGKRIG